MKQKHCLKFLCLILFVATIGIINFYGQTAELFEEYRIHHSNSIQAVLDQVLPAYLPTVPKDGLLVMSVPHWDETKKKKLEFLHIPKTGGSSVELAAGSAGISWGSCKFFKFGHCGSTKPSVSYVLRDRVKIAFPYLMVPWHSPIHWMSKQLRRKVYPGSMDTFAVVRNPYERYISEFKYSKMLRGERNRLSNDNVDGMNRWIQTAIKQSQNHLLRFPNGARKKKKVCCHLTSGHVLPQHFFVFNSNHTQVVTHVLKLEQFPEAFDELMQMYDLNVTLGKQLKMAPTNDNRPSINLFKATSRPLSVRDLKPQTILAINTFAREDFEWFGYKMLKPYSKPDDEKAVRQRNVRTINKKAERMSHKLKWGKPEQKNKRKKRKQKNKKPKGKSETQEEKSETEGEDEDESGDVETVPDDAEEEGFGLVSWLSSLF